VSFGSRINEVMGKIKALPPIVALMILLHYPATAQVFTTLVNLNGDNGATPMYMTMIEADDGNLYGTTVAGGANGFGVLFQMTLNGQIQILHSFCDSGCPNGSQPYGGVVQGKDGHLYGTTALGGHRSHPDGTIFKTTLGGQFKVLYKFCGGMVKGKCIDGSLPLAPPVEGQNGKFYLTTSGGLSGEPFPSAIKISSNASATILCSYPKHCTVFYYMRETQSSLIQAKDNIFYGTAGYGEQGNGTIFKIKSGKVSSFYNFCNQTNCADGLQPLGPLTIGKDGNFYGTTFGQPSESWATKYGTVFSITPRGRLTTLYAFCTQVNCTDGAYPTAGLVQGTDGNFYGTTTMGGTNDDGTIFQVTPQGVLTVLHSFSGSDGSDPSGGLIQASNRLFYGSTSTGGSGNKGTIYSLDMGLR
jgi:uncharacterized repeat protein (TIGR03803 family)